MDAQMEQMPSVVTTALVVVSVIFPCLSLISIFLRYQARRAARQRLEGDDWFVAAAWILTFGLSINAWVFGAKLGINYVNIDPILGVENSLLCLLTSSAILQVALAVVKISVLLFFKRIFPTPKFRIAVWIGIVTVAIWGILFFFLVIFEGDPVSAAWLFVGKMNLNVYPFGMAQCGTSIALDVIILCYPLPILFNLQMRTSRKVAIGFIFWLGAFCCVAAIVRLVLLHASLAKVAVDQNAVSNQPKQYIFMILEPNCSIMAACLPCYGPLLTGAKAPESLLRRMRSILSIRSRSSKGTFEKSHAPSQDDNSHGSQAEKAPSDSTVALAGAEPGQVWTKTPADANTVNVHCASLTEVDDEETGQRGIYMEKQYDVTRSEG